MNDPRPTISKTKKVIIIIFLSLAFIMISIIIYQKITSPKQVNIANINLYLKNHANNKTSLDSIKHDLYNTIALNTNQDPSKLKDILIRNNSFEQKKNGTVYTTSFIVDIASLKQSYRVSYQWDEKGNTNNLDEWGSVVSCVKADEVIYPDFHCKDYSTETAGTTDNTAALLPHFVANKYNISAVIVNGEISEIKIDIFSCTSSADTYESEAKEWLKSQNINMEKYKIVVNYCATD